MTAPQLQVAPSASDATTRRRTAHRDIDHDGVRRAAGDLLRALGADIDGEGLEDTPRRVADAYAELLTPQPFRATTFANRFDEDPAAAARFGIYTAAIWIVAFVLAVVLGFTLGWIWVPVALVGGFVAMLITLARMLFGVDARSKS